LIAFDTTNARYLWKRIPAGLKEGVLDQTWQIAKYIIDKDYAQVFNQITALR